MNILIQQLEEKLPPKMIISEALKRLYEWIEDNQLYIDSDNCVRTGFLYPESKLKESWTDNERYGGTIIRFSTQSNKYLKYWFGKESYEIYSRLCVFALSGSDSSGCALWLDDDGNTKIVHMGSGTGSLLCCTLAEDAIDFLRLLFVGSDEICWVEYYDYPPSSNTDFCVHPNTEFQNWVKKTFNVAVPQTAAEIVKYPVEMGDKNALDAFCNWCNVQTQYS